ncbi:uncharacterized protein CDV56_108825 [Aspergillus thermomutatus]|uniref:Uncharacterized protein n=1 Tax=Aspergillus thermomutatus TaxID=41047 RepID=A0A397HCJ0_ASPTH|nr:uncharacterized protein CDV56_108825 [Aspergillus thermomutatus]RHZ60825.1 hypothetical protein CDV56_108825 [Aspergillus thermomutatus]
MARRIPGVRTTPAASLWRASTLPLFLLAVLLLYILPANGLDTQRWPQGSLVVERTTDKLVARADNWDVYKEKGRRMHCAMNGDQEAANQYGWVVDDDEDPDMAMGQDTLANAFEELNIDAEKNFLVRIDHSRAMTVDGKPYKESEAYYQSLFNMKAGLIVADDNKSPEYMQKNSNWKPEQFVPLKQWSDVIFLLWERAAREANSNVQNLEHIFRSIVINGDTLAIMRRAIGKPADFEGWGELRPMKEKGRTFRPGSDAYYALLYSPNGRGVGWLLIQHKAKLGLRTVSEITVFGGSDGEPVMYFKIEPVKL